MKKTKAGEIASLSFLWGHILFALQCLGDVNHKVAHTLNFGYKVELLYRLKLYMQINYFLTFRLLFF